MSAEKKWKRGDIGPDGRVFWQYGKSYKNGERWIDADRHKQLHEKAEDARRRYIQENRENVLEYRRRYHQENREKLLERHRHYHQENREKALEYSRRYNQENREKVLKAYRRKGLKKHYKNHNQKHFLSFTLY
jgi:hypothetical protein